MTMMSALLKASLILSLVGLSAATCLPAVPLSSTLIYEFPNTSVRAIENVGLTDYGSLLLNTITGPNTYLLNPNVPNPTATVVATYTNASASLGIAEIAPNKFAVAVGNYTVATKTAIPGTFAIWTLDVSNPSAPVAKLLTAVPEADAFNGMTTVPGTPGLVLVADSTLGATFAIDTTTGSYDISIKDPLFDNLSTFPLGINGIRTLGDTLYFTNSALGIFGKVGITSAGTATGPAVKIASSVPGNIFDDFALDTFGNAFIANHPHAVTEVTTCGTQFTIENSTTSYMNPTSAIFAKTVVPNCVLYVVTDGLFTTNPIVAGQVYEIKFC